MMKKGMADKMGRAMPMRGDMADKMGRAMAPQMMMKKGGKVKPKKMMDGGMAYSKGGSASSRADGIARKGKTKGKMMRYGGTC